LAQELRELLVSTAEEPLWLAGVEVFTREGRTDWVEQLGRLLNKREEPPSGRFWDCLAYAAYRLGSTPVAAQRLESTLHIVKGAHSSAAVTNGLETMIEAVRSADRVASGD
jgi:hypothetical protein